MYKVTVLQQNTGKETIYDLDDEFKNFKVGSFKDLIASVEHIPKKAIIL